MGGVISNRCVYEVLTCVEEAQHNSMVHEAILYLSDNLSFNSFQGQFQSRILYFVEKWIPAYTLKTEQETLHPAT